MMIRQFQLINCLTRGLRSGLPPLRNKSTTKGDRKLCDKVAIVTGSTEGIGFAIANRLAEDGAKIVISSRKKDKVDKAVEELKSKFPDQIEGIVCHVGNTADQEQLVDFTMNKFGAIHCLVSNVAVNPYFGNMMEMEESHWDKIFDVNVKAPFMLTRRVVPHMLKNRCVGDKGAIVYISSIAAYSGLASIGAYSISKTALLGLCKNMSMELGNEGIRVNLVAPGVIKTKFSAALTGEDAQYRYEEYPTHLKRFGEPHEIAGIVSLLCGPDGSYITGENIVVSGGYHCGL